MPINGTIKVPAKAKAVEPQLSVYDTMDANAASEVRDAASRIRDRIAGIKTSIIDIGKDLLMVKAKLKDEHGHGKFGDWLEAEFGMSERTAQRYMSAASELGDISDTVSDLPAKVLYALAAPSTPDVVKEVVTAEVKAGKTPTVADVMTMVAEAKTIEATTPDMPVEKKAAAVTAAVATKKETVQEQAAKIVEKVKENVKAEIAAEAKLSPAEQKAHDRAVKQAVALLFQHLPEGTLAKLTKHCVVAGWHELASALTGANHGG